ncbi:hypothetical protein SNE40_003884 [Patella caerulea]|uniref:Mannosyltransferase n=1 Tax=Patella caerulea TaxID=87958 RepID=A0AAN8KJ82_PATCE
MTQRRKKAFRVPSRLFQQRQPQHQVDEHEQSNDNPDRSTSNRKHKNNFTEETVSKLLLPTWLPWFLVFFNMASRVHYVMKPKNWWILHPDEVFQGVEVAHSVVNGYGFRMYEYLPPLPLNRSTAAEDQEYSLGIYSMRSFLYPYLFTPFLYVTRYMGLKVNSFLVCKVIHAILSSLLPLAVYRFTRALYNSADIAVMTSAFVAFSLQLNVFGTHCLASSLVAPFFFLTLSEVLFFIDKDDNAGLTKEKKMESKIKWSPKYKKIGTVIEYVIFVLNGFQKESEVDTDIEKDSVSKFSSYRVIFSSFILGLVVYVKINLLLPLILLVVMEIIHHPEYITNFRFYWKRYTWVKVGITAALLLGGYVDFLTYGVWFLSPIQWIRFSFIRDMSSKYFDKSFPMEYIQSLNMNGSTTVLNAFASVVILLTLHRSQFKWSTVSVIMTATTMVVVYSMQWHKELRLIHNVYVFVCILWAVAIRTAMDMFKLRKYRWLSTVMVSLIICAFALDSYADFPTAGSQSSAVQWSHNNIQDSAAINNCIEKTSARGNLTGLFIDYTLYATGGFSLLNKDVPLLTRVQHEYYEYDLSDRPLYRSGLDPGIRAMNRMSDIIHTLSTNYLHKTLTTKKQYNYIITKDPEVFYLLDFDATLRCSQFYVLRRLTPPSKPVERVSNIKTKKSKRKTNDSFSPLPDVLEYEGSWLLTIGHYRKSSERLRACISHGSSRVRPYQLLSLCYYRSGNITAVKSIETECYTRYGQEKCDQPQPRLILHQNYNVVS